MSNADRRFLVARQGTDIVIREVVPNTNGHEFTRESAWTHAARIAQSRKGTKAVGARGKADRCYFIGLDNNRIVIPMPDAPVTEPVEDNSPKPLDNGNVTVHNTPMSKPSDKQVTFFNSLMTQIMQRTDANAEYDKGFTADTSKQAASDAISAALKWLKENPAAKPAQESPKAQETDREAVPAGRYALRQEDDTVKFYKVEHGKAGTRWDGYTFLKAMASDDLYPIRNGEERKRILSTIGADVKAAFALYGQEIGRCGHCNRTLTSEWRNIGIGPICSQGMGL